MKTFQRFLTLVILIVFPVRSFSQGYNTHEQARIDRFDIRMDSIDPGNEIDMLNLDGFLKSDKQHRRRKTAGYVLAAVGASILVGGIALASQRDNNGDTNPYEGLIGGTFIVVGAVIGGVSIPFFTSAARKKKERNNLLEKLREQY